MDNSCQATSEPQTSKEQDRSVDEKLQHYSRFFNTLVQLIPSKYYFGEEADYIDIKHLRTTEKLAAQQLLRKKRKENKRLRLDPNAPSTTLEQQRVRSATSVEASTSDITTHNGSRLKLHFEAGSTPSRETLRDRLQRRLQDFRQQRKNEQQIATSQNAQEWRERTRAATLANQKPSKKRKAPPSTSASQPAATDPSASLKPKSRAIPQGQLSQEIQNLAFGKLVVEQANKERKTKKKTKVQLLKTAEKKLDQRKQLQGSEEGKDVLAREAWGAALAKAHGEKVLDDPKLLKRSIKKETKLKQKKARAWKERTDKQKEEMESRQSKRKENLDKRAGEKVERKKAKREKKLLRAGFEGRKSGFIEAGTN